MWFIKQLLIWKWENLLVDGKCIIHGRCVLCYLVSHLISSIIRLKNTKYNENFHFDFWIYVLIILEFFVFQVHIAQLHFNQWQNTFLIIWQVFVNEWHNFTFNTSAKRWIMAYLKSERKKLIELQETNIRTELLTRWVQNSTIFDNSSTTKSMHLIIGSLRFETCSLTIVSMALNGVNEITSFPYKLLMAVAILWRSSFLSYLILESSSGKLKEIKLYPHSVSMNLHTNRSWKMPLIVVPPVNLSVSTSLEPSDPISLLKSDWNCRITLWINNKFVSYVFELILIICQKLNSL